MTRLDSRTGAQTLGCRRAGVRPGVWRVLGRMGVCSTCVWGALGRLGVRLGVWSTLAGVWSMRQRRLSAQLGI
ncbi:hypothetical protein CDL15_Pgr007979 [Punica granatum]|uniref:Uncharacterized protein n=1 Tax=Punica granatum TaxID=22663 RepID=A0A218XB51_PUNGR|nr:hypothetical protein CDL15_Pgr007979 [Punica granatum]